MEKEKRTQEKGQLVYPPVELKHAKILVSSIRYKEKTKSGLILTDSTKGGATKAPLLPYQVVVAAGANAAYDVGDVVKIDVDSFQRKPKKNPHDMGDAGYETIYPVEFIEGEVYLFLFDNQIKWKLTEVKSAQSKITELRENMDYV